MTLTDTLARVAALAADQQAKRTNDRARTAQERAANRLAMPRSAALADALAARLGPIPWQQWTEAGRTVEAGTHLPDRIVPNVPGLHNGRVPPTDWTREGP